MPSPKVPTHIAPSRLWITLNTETGAWPKPRGAINELRGDQADITWDEAEKIEIYRRELPQLVADGHILEARRM